MFERYTEAARRLIFLARKAAADARSPHVEPEHFALALLAEKNLFGRLLPDGTDALESAIKETLVLQNSAQPATDFPLSRSLKRVLAYGAEAAETLKDPQIRPEHLLLGLLRE